MLKEEFVYIKHRNKLLDLEEKGTRYYAVLDSDRLNLYPDEETARKLDQTWKDLPEEQYVIFRQSQTGLVEEDSLQMSICLMVQDNQCKMTNLKIKLTIDQENTEQ